MNQPRILVIDDNPGDRALIIRALKQELPQAEIRQILERGSLNRALAAKDFDVVVTDFQIRWITGLDVLLAVRQVDDDIPVIMFTNTGTEEIAVEAMKLGLDDYILKKPSNYVFLPPAVKRALDRAVIRKRAAGLTEEQFQNLNQSLQSILTISLSLLSDDSQSQIPIDYRDELQQIYQKAQGAAEVVQDLFRYRLSELEDSGSV